MKAHSNIEPLQLYVYKYLNTMELKLKSKTKKPTILPNICEPVTLRKSKYYHYSSFIPDESPYVIDVFRCLVNAIEKDSKSQLQWDKNASSTKPSREVKKLVKSTLAEEREQGIATLKTLIEERSNDFVLHFFQYSLKQFFPKLIHFRNDDLLPVMTSTLYDSTMRANPKFQSVVKHIILRSNRTIMDTAAFVMIHLFHVWEYSNNMVEAKKQIVENYGRLIISFECTPILVDREDLAPDSCLLGIILETTSISFWNNLTSHKVFEAFDMNSNFEKGLKRRVVKTNLFPEIPGIMKYDTPHLKMPISYFFSNENVNQEVETKMSEETLSSYLEIDITD